MKVVIVGEFLRALPWSPSRWIADLTRGLAGRGHAVTLCVDGLEDPRERRLPAEILLRRPTRTVRNRQPIRFQRWARSRLAELARAGRADATLSLTRLCEAGLWAPIGPPSRREFGALIRARSIATVGMETLQQPWLPAAVLAERSARRAFERDPHARRGILGSATEPDGRTLALGYASDLTPLPDEHADAARSRVRRMLSIPERAPLLVVAATHLTRRGLGECLAGVAALSDEPFVVLLGRDTHSIHQVVLGAGLGSRARLVGVTRALPELFAAAEVLVQPGAVIPRDSTARLTCDALRCGLPIVAAARAPGGELIAPNGSPPRGLVVDDPSPGGWSSALSRALDPDWNRAAREAAGSIAPCLSLGALVERVEAALESLADR